MHRIDEEGATPQNGFTDGDVQTGVDATTVGEDWLNAVQEEIANVIEAAGIVLDKADNGQLLQALGGGGSGMKNLLINGEFVLYDRPTTTGGSIWSIGDSAIYGPDRWVGRGDGTGGPGTLQLSWGGFSPSDHRVGSAANNDQGNAYRKLFFVVNNDATVASPYLEQRVENSLIEYVGEELTFSIYVDAPAGVTGTIQISQHFGDAGGASPEVVFATKAIVPGSEPTWRRFSVTGTCPVIDGKTINGTPSIRVRFTSDMGQVAGYHTIQLTLAQLERGASPSGFGHRPYGVERMLGARYFERSWDNLGGTTSKGGDQGYCAAGSRAEGLYGTFMAEKRVLPTITWYNAGKTPGFIEWPGNLAVTGTSVPSLRITGNPNVTPNGPEGIAFGHWTADAEI